MPARQPRFALKPTLLACLLAFPAQQALAASCTWNPASGNWSIGANWSCGFVPTGGPDAAIIAGGKAVTVDTAQSILNLSNSGSVNIDAFLLTLAGGGGTTNTGTINVGSAVTAALQVSAGHNIGNTGGTINVANGSVLNQFGSSITGGTINTTGTGKVVGFNSGSNFLSGVTLNGSLDLASGTGIERVTGGLTLNGTVNIGNNSVLAPQGNQTIGGNGTIVFADGSASNRLNVEAGNLTLGPNVTVRGQTGVVGQQAFVGGAATLTNNGTIQADVAGGAITLQVNGLTTNNGTLAALNGGTLNLNSNIAGNVGSQILAGAGSTVVQNGVTISGIVNTTGTGSFRASSSGSNIFDGVSLSGTLDLASATGIERAINGLTLNSATINIGNNSVLAPQGNQTIGGNGTIVFADGNASNRLNVEAGNLTLGPNVTVRGQTGVIGQQAFAGGAATLTNNGTIQADVAGGAITLQVSGLTTNNGTLAALNGGTLNLNSNVAGNVGSQILAGAGSTVVQNGVTISGIVNTTGTGSFRASNSGSNIFDGVSFSGTLDLASATGIERAINGLTLNSATINIGNNSVLAPQGNQTIGGTGTIVFADSNASNRLNVEAGNLTLDSGIVVRGERGIIGQQAFAGGAATLTNNGIIQVDVAGGAITLQVNGLTTNNGTLAALNGSTLNLNSAIVGNTGSQILAGAGSVVAQNGVTISGDMNLTGPGSFRPSNSGSNFLSGVTLSGTLDLASATGIERVAGGLTLSGGAAINIGNNSVLAPQGNQTIGGTGTIVFADSNASNRLNVEAGNLTLGSNITVRGGNGIIGQQAFAGGAATLTNQGLISADVNGRSITLGVNGSVINQGTMQAKNGGQLILNAGGGYDNSAGVMLADVGGTVLINGATIAGGALNSNGTGVFKAASSSNNFLNGVTLNGVLDMASAASIERISTGGMTLNGTISIGANSILAPQGNQTIGGAGSIVFADGSASNRLNVEAGNLVIGSGVTVHGQTGIIGQQAFAGGAATLTNNGTINADAGGTITVNVNGALTNNGAMRAQNGTLTIQDALGGSGTLQVDASGVMNLANLANTQGRLAMGAAGSTLNIGTQNLTINTDYTSIVAGTGDSFNRRAGVSGSGQILAGGDAAQAITGTGVSNGSTASATLTIGNVRVGATTFDYQIANTGSTGPSLRGAVQTSANGASLTDARLSGAGVTAGNYNTGAPGSSTGNLGVTFTVASAGALAPLSGQVLNLRSNFDNIADQKLNIVLGGGAAAYNAAVGNTASPVQVANQRIGGSATSILTVANTAAAGSFSEDLHASVGGSSGAASGSGSITGRLAGTNNTGAGAIAVAIDTGSAGAKTGTVTLNYQTAGAVAGVSNGLGTASAGNQVVTVNGNVYQVAQPTTLPANVNLGNFRAGTPQLQTVTLTNTNLAPGFQEGLNATITGTSGAGAGSGALNNVAAGSSGNLQIGVTGVAGVNTGTVQVQLATNGTGTSGLGDLNLGGVQTVNVAGTGWRLASANTQPATINFGNVLQGSTQASFLNIQNTAIADGFSERLDSRFLSGGTTGDATNNGGSISLLGAGASNNTAMAVGVNTGAIGAKTGQVIVAFDSNGAATSGLGITGLPNQNIGILANVTAVVGTLAQPSLISPNPVSFGNFRVGAPGAAPVNLSIGNTATIGEGLNASIATGSAGFGATGAFTSLAPTATNNSSLLVSFNGTATAGAKSGSATVTLVSDGTFNSGVTTALASQTVVMNANVFNVAQPAGLPSSVNIGSFRTTGSPITQTIALTNTNISPPGFQEGLNATIVGTSGNGAAIGALNNVVAGGSGNLQIGVTGIAGVNSGTAQVQFASNGTGTSGLATLNLGGPQTVNVTGLGYTTAVGQLNTTTVDFGIVRVGDIVSANNIAVKNTAAATALNDTLRANLSGVAGPFSNSNTVGGVGAQSIGNIAVALGTGTAGIFSQTGSVGFLSQNPDMADVSAGADGSVLVKAQINNLANAHFSLRTGSGTLTQSGNIFTLDLGNITLSSSNALTLKLDNNVFGPADDLSGLFNLALVDDFTLTGWGAISGLGAGQSSGDLDLSYLASALGLFEDTIDFDGFSTNASDPSGIAQHRRLIILANVIDTSGSVPEPGTLLLLAIALAGMLFQRRRTVLH